MEDEEHWLPSVVRTIKDGGETREEPLPENLVRAITIDGFDDSDAQKLLLDYHKKGNWHCECGLVFHLQSTDSGLVSWRNPPTAKFLQNISCTYPCCLSKRSSAVLNDRPLVRPAIKQPNRHGLILDHSLGRVIGPSSGIGSLERQASDKVNKSGWTLLWSLMEEARLNRWEKTSCEPTSRDQWLALHRASESTKLTQKKLSLSEIAWMPLPEEYFVPGLSLQSRIVTRWPFPKKIPEGCVFTVLSDIPEPSGSVRITTGIADGKTLFERHPQGLPSPKYYADLSDKCFDNRRRNGPFLVLMVGHVVGNLPDSEPMKFLRFIAQPVLSETHFIPVESDSEREAANLLIEMGIDFKKPLFVNNGALPDFAIPGLKRVLEVQGMTLPSYRKEKEERLKRTEVVAKSRGYELLRWDPNDGETILDLRKKIEAVQSSMLC